MVDQVDVTMPWEMCPEEELVPPDVPQRSGVPSGSEQRDEPCVDQR